MLKEIAMMTSSLFLRRALLADAIVSGATGLLQTLAPSVLAPLLNLPGALLLETGLFLVVYAGLVGWMSQRERLPATLVWLVIIGNAAWMVGSLALIGLGPLSPSWLGIGFILMQAVAVGLFAELQFIGLRKTEKQSGRVLA
jgi:hypothetical protein